MGGQGSGMHRKKYNVAGLGQLKLSTIARLLDKGYVRLEIKESISNQFKEFDAILIDDSKDKIIIKGFKNIMVIE